jgi:molecular chaperone GrpE
MADASKQDKPLETEAEYQARMKKMNAELFGDLDGGEDEEETECATEIEGALEPETQDYTTLLADFTAVSAKLEKAQADNLALQKQLATQKEESTTSLNRIQKQTETDKVFALGGFVKAILPVIDTLERGLAAIPQTTRVEDPKFGKFAEGVEKTLVQLTSVFNKFGIEVINPMGEDFNPEKHAAINTTEEGDAEPDTVVDVAQKGYELGGRLIRAASVVVKR